MKGSEIEADENVRSTRPLNESLHFMHFILTARRQEREDEELVDSGKCVMAARLASSARFGNSTSHHHLPLSPTRPTQAHSPVDTALGSQSLIHFALLT